LDMIFLGLFLVAITIHQPGGFMSILRRFAPKVAQDESHRA
jgi:hypothetical protein